MKNLAKIVFAFAIAWASVAAQGADIVIGQVNQLKDPASIGNQIRAGAQLYFDAVNEQGGIHGARLKLVTRDRGPSGGDTVEKTRLLLAEEKPVALIGITGTGPMEALVKEKVLDNAAVPLVGVRTGSVSLHQPVQRWVFHTRANYGQEVDKIAAHMATLGRRKIAVFYEKSVFGLEGYAQAQRAIKARKLSLAGSATYEYRSTDVKAAAQDILRTSPDGIIAVATSAALAEFYKQVKPSDGNALVVGISVADGSVIVKRIGAEAAHGLGIAQVVPDPASKTTVLARQLQEDQRKHGPDLVLNAAMTEGYIAARVLAEGLKRAGPRPTPAKLRTGLEAIKDLDLGGYRVRFSPSSHSGSSYVDIGVISPDGRILR